MKGDVTRLDSNFKQQSVIIQGDDKIVSLPSKDIDLYGGYFDYSLGNFQRMDASVAKNLNYNLEVLSSTTSGMRARFKTDSKKFGISVKYRYLAKMAQMPFSGTSGFILLEEDNDGYNFVGSFKPSVQNENGFDAQISLKGELKNYILFFPLYNDYITEIKLVFDKDSVISNGNKYRFDLPILFYGSSITQGGCCSRPDNCYPAYISKWNNVDYLNLGFSGGAKGESGMIEYLKNIPSKVFVCDYDHNAPSADHLAQTHYKLYFEYRSKNPTTPIVFMTKPDFDRDKNNNLKRLKVIKSTYVKAKESGDNNVYFLDGRKLFGKKDRENCTVDGCHPNDLGFYRMALALNKILEPLLK